MNSLKRGEDSQALTLESRNQEKERKKQGGKLLHGRNEGGNCNDFLASRKIYREFFFTSISGFQLVSTLLVPFEDA